MPSLHRAIPSALLALALTLGLAACSSPPPKPQVDFKQDYNFMQARKVAFYHKSGQVSGDNPLQISDMQRQRANQALQQALVKRGYEFVEDPAQADLLMSWHLSTQDKTDVRTYQSGPSYGYGYNRYSRYNCWSCGGGGGNTQVSVKEYTEGTFIVDMIDPKLQQSVWRGVTQSRLKGNTGQEQSVYDAAADRIFASFPP